MAEYSFPFNARLVDGEWDRTVDAERMGALLNRWIGIGVRGEPMSFNIVTNGDMTVTVGTGVANVGSKDYENTTPITFRLDPADGVLNRKDVIFLRRSREGRVVSMQLIKGTPAVSPTAPAIRRDADFFDLKLYEISIRAGATQITQADITDTRLDTTVCGIVAGLIDQVDTTTLYNQIQADLANFRNVTQAEYNTWTAAKKAAYDSWVAAKQAEYDTWTADKKSAYDAWVATSKSDYDEYISATQTAYDTWTAEKKAAYDTWVQGRDAAFMAWWNTIKATLGEDAAGNLLNLINNHTADHANPHGVTKADVGLPDVPNVVPYHAGNKPTKADVGLGNVDNTADAAKPISTATQTALNAKVDKVTGKVLSTNDFTAAYKAKVDLIKTDQTAKKFLAGDGSYQAAKGDKSYKTITIGIAGGAYTADDVDYFIADGQDAATVINSVIANAPSCSTITLFPGTYTLSADINLKSNISFSGVANESTVLRVNYTLAFPSSGAAINVQNGLNIKIYGIAIVGTGANNIDGILLKTCQDCDVHDVRISSAFTSIQVSNQSNGIKIYKCKIEKVDGDDSKKITVVNNVFTSTAQGLPCLSFSGCDYLFLANNNITFIKGGGFEIWACSNVNIESNTIKATVDGYGKMLILRSNNTGYIMSNVVVSNNTFYGTGYQYGGIEIQGINDNSAGISVAYPGTLHEMCISNNVFNNCSLLRSSHNTNTVFSGNCFYNTKIELAGCTDITICGCSIVCGHANELVTVDESKRIIINSNRIGFIGQSGGSNPVTVAISAGSTDIQVSNNVFNPVYETNYGSQNNVVATGNLLVPRRPSTN